MEQGLRIWKGAAIKRGLEHGRRGIGIVRSRYQATTKDDIGDWEILIVLFHDS
jgi:hypothetical protein